MASVIAGYQPQPMLDPRARPIYFLVGAEALLAIILASALGFTVETTALFKPLPGAALLLVCGLLARRIGHAKVGTACEALALVFFHTATSLLIALMITAVAFPFADGWLAGADALLGFHAPAFIAFVVNKPVAVNVLAWAYASLGWQIIPLLVILIATDRIARMWQAVTALILSLAITLAIYPFVPAQGTFVHFGIQRASYPLLDAQPWKFAHVIEIIRDQGVRTIDSSLIAGLVSFPSWHTAAAIIFTWAVWPVRWLRYPAPVLNALVIVGALIFGAHYLIDLIGGAAVAALSIWAARSWMRKGSGLTS